MINLLSFWGLIAFGTDYLCLCVLLTFIVFACLHTYKTQLFCIIKMLYICQCQTMMVILILKWLIMANGYKWLI